MINYENPGQEPKGDHLATPEEVKSAMDALNDGKEAVVADDMDTPPVADAGVTEQEVSDAVSALNGEGGESIKSAESSAVLGLAKTEKAKPEQAGQVESKENVGVAGASVVEAKEKPERATKTTESNPEALGRIRESLKRSSERPLRLRKEPMMAIPFFQMTGQQEKAKPSSSKEVEESYQICEVCKGKGRRWFFFRCRVCDGTGRIVTNKRVKVTK